MLHSKEGALDEEGEDVAWDGGVCGVGGKQKDDFRKERKIFST